MKFILNEFPDDKSFEPDEKWTPLKESENVWVIQLLALPFAIINVFLVLVIMNIMGITYKYNFGYILISFLIFIPIHELIHAIFFPGGIKSSKTYFGFMTKGFIFFSAYIGEMKRNIFILSLMAPIIWISIVGFVCLAIIGSNDLIEHIIIMNAFGACVDCLGSFMLYMQVPRDAVIKNKKNRSYWKETIAKQSNIA